MSALCLFLLLFLTNAAFSTPSFSLPFDKIFLFLPNSLLKVITLPTHFLVKTMAKTLGMVAHMAIVRPKPTKADT